jgi:hypothetical protein
LLQERSQFAVDLSEVGFDNTVQLRDDLCDCNLDRAKDQQQHLPDLTGEAEIDYKNAAAEPLSYSYVFLPIFVMVESLLSPTLEEDMFAIERRKKELIYLCSRI